MNIAERIGLKIKKTWSKAPTLAESELLEMYHTNPRLDGVRIIAEKCASTELFLYKRDEYRANKSGAEKIVAHEIYNLLENPCPTFRDLNGWNVRYFVFACYMLAGEAYLLKIRTPSGKVIALTPIVPSWVIHQPTDNGKYWEIYPYGTTASNSIKVPVEDVISFKNIDLSDPYGHGRGVAETIGDEIQSDEYAARYSKNLFFNDATPSAIIYVPEGTKETADQIKQSWRQKMAGLWHAHEPMVLTGHDSRFEKISETPREMDFVESRRFLRDTANQQFHIPPEIFGILENSNRSTIDSAFYLLNKNVLADPLRMYERVMNTQLLWEDFDKEETLILAHENTVEEDIEQKLKIVNEGLSRGVITRNEWRVAMGYEPDEKNGDVYLMGFSTVEQQQNSDPVELPETEPEKPEEITLPETGKDESEEKRRTAIWKQFDARARSIEEPFKKQARKAFAAQNMAVKEAIIEALQKNKDIPTVIENLYNHEMDEKMKRTMASAFKIGLDEGAKIGLERMGKKAYKDLSTVQEWFNTWIDNYGLELCIDMDKTTKEKLKKVLSDAIEEGDGLYVREQKLMAACDGLFEEFSKARAELIARTESCTTMNAGSTMIYKSEGVQAKEWISTMDNRTRDAHLEMDGITVGIDDKFNVMGGEPCTMDYPGDPTAPAGQVCNCRCTVSPVINF